ncbi:MAG TPA: hypothetical protein VNH18_30090 [Bryobacteraceae bacterium]|nr:hypothetical protein [Bryobacteraceae bacterium]HXJ43571.1 hypothetical protein [Bryobacteraceae bacterium]
MTTHSVLRMVALLGVSLGSPGNSHEPRDIPHVERAEPDVVQAGNVVTAFGEHLDWSHVADVLLSDGVLVALAHIVEQESNFLRFRIPRSLEPGLYSVVLATAEQQSRLLDQQVMITVKRSDKR